MLGAAGLLLTIGLVMVFSASSIEAALNNEPAWAPGVQQLIWAVLGVGAMLVALRLPAGFLRRWSPIALIVVVVMLLLVLVPFIGVKLNGARQWFNLGFAHLQPSEVGKLVFALWGAHVLALRERYLTTTSLLVPVLPVFARALPAADRRAGLRRRGQPRPGARRPAVGRGDAAALVRLVPGRRRGGARRSW